MKDQVVLLQGEWRVLFQSQMLKPGWPSKGAAQACLGLLQQGKGTVVDGHVKWGVR